MRYISIFLFLFSTVISALGQNNTDTLKNGTAPDTILFVNGYKIAAHVTDTSSDEITFEKLRTKKHKEISVSRENVFSIRYGSTGQEELIYFYDTLTGNDYTIAEARLFIAGEQDAERGYRGRVTSIAAFAIGVASGITGASWFVFAPPFLFSAIMDYPRIHIRHKSVTNLKNVKFDPYLFGYDNIARRKRTLRSLLWGGVGVAVGLSIYFAAQLKNR